jgi:hypothetical protein
MDRLIVAGVVSASGQEMHLRGKLCSLFSIGTHVELVFFYA